MNSDVISPHEAPRPVDSNQPPWLRTLILGEDFFIVLALAVMMLLPVTEIILRSVFKTGISGSSAIVQHLTLIVGMLGGAIAARQGRLLALSPAQTLLKGWAKSAAHVFGNSFGAAISFFLCLASYQYVMALNRLAKFSFMGSRSGLSNLLCHWVLD